MTKDAGRGEDGSPIRNVEALTGVSLDVAKRTIAWGRPLEGYSRDELMVMVAWLASRVQEESDRAEAYRRQINSVAFGRFDR